MILGCLIGAGVLMILFLIAERVQGDGAMFDLSLFRKPTFTGGSLAAFGLSGGLFALFLYLTLYLQDVLGYSAIQTGLRFLFLSGGILLTSALAWTGKTLKGFSGVIVENLHQGRTLLEAYGLFYVLAAAIGVPGILICLVLAAHPVARSFQSARQTT